MAGVRSPRMNVSEDGTLSEAMPIGALEDGTAVVEKLSHLVINSDLTTATATVI